MPRVLLVLRLPDGDRDIAVEFDDRATVGQLVDRVQAHVGPRDGTRRTLERLTRTRSTLAREARLSRESLRSGDVVRLAPDTGLREQEHAVTVGRVRIQSPGRPATVAAIPRGETILGRAASCDLPLDDDLASRRHAKLVATDVIEVVDLGSTNATLVNDVPVVAPRRLRVGDEVRIGDTVLTVEQAEQAALDDDATGNQVEFNRPPRIDRPYEGVEITVPAPPDDPPKQRLPAITALVPLLMGVALYLMTRSLFTVAFIAMSPLFLLGSYWENKRSGRADHAERLAQHEQDVAAVLDRLDEEREREVASRFEQAPAVGALDDHVRELSQRLWERQPGDADFLDLRVGLAELPSRTTVKVDTGGSRALRPAVEEIPGRYATLPPVPVQVSFAEVGSIGVSGPSPYAGHVARSLIAQTATLHSPSEVVVCALVAEEHEQDWRWLTWLPHTRSPLSPVAGTHLASSVDDALGLLAELGRLIADRRPDPGSGGATVTEPHVVVLVDDTLPIERARLTGLLESGPAVGVHTLWLSASARRLPKTCGAVIDLGPSGQTARIGWVERRETVEDCRVELLDADAARTLARDLSPVIDVSSRQSREAGIPRSAALVDLLGGPQLLDDPAEILARWHESRPGRGLRAAVGAGASGVFSIDLRHDGPHGLVAGTTGAGKSEFLQSLLVGLAATHSPSRVNMLLVDYKGGSAFKDTVGLPHTVGLVTDLTPALVKRALTSLRAELHRRERLLNEANAKDLLQMEQEGHPQTPPSLVIVVDEFAALAREVPEFVDGVVDIAQRGRSLGLHLLLATQRPAGVVTENIRANANLKVALRVASEEESTDVVGAPDAGHIDRSIPGRAVARLGPSELIAFQSGYLGGRTTGTDDEPALAVADVTFHGLAPWPDPDSGRGDGGSGPTDLERFVTTITEAFHRSGEPTPRRPWLDPLAPMYDLGKLPHPGTDDRLPIGVVDDPVHQWQRLAHLELDRDGSVLVYGSSGAGKTAALRTVAVSAARSGDATPVHVYGIDAAGRGLDMLLPLPQVGGIVTLDDYDRMTRLLTDLAELVDDRGRLFAEQRASSLAEYRANAGGAPMPRVLVLLDGFENFQSTWERIDRGQWFDLVQRLVADGRSVGVHFVMTGGRRSAFPTVLASTVGRRLVLRMATRDEYLAMGIDAGLVDGDEPPGRCVDGDQVMQLALLGGRPATAAQAQAVRELADQLAAAGVPPAPPVRVLPDVVPLAEVLADAGSVPEDRLPVGRDDRLGVFSLPANDRLLVTGPARSGRSTAIATMATAAQRQGRSVVVLAGRRPVEGLARTVPQVVGAADVAATAKQLADRPSLPLVLVDELEELLDSEAEMPLSDLLRRDDLAIVAACEVTVARRSYSSAMQTLKRGRTVFLLQPDADMDTDLANAPLPRTRRQFPPGRGIHSVAGALTVAQWAHPTAAADA